MTDVKLTPKTVVSPRLVSEQTQVQYHCQGITYPDISQLILAARRKVEQYSNSVVTQNNVAHRAALSKWCRILSEATLIKEKLDD